MDSRLPYNGDRWVSVWLSEDACDILTKTLCCLHPPREILYHFKIICIVETYIRDIIFYKMCKRRIAPYHYDGIQLLSTSIPLSLLHSISMMSLKLYCTFFSLHGSAIRLIRLMAHRFSLIR